MACSSGIVSTQTPAARSDQARARRAPTRAAMPPATIDSTTTGTVSHTAAIPVSTALPVVSNTNHGNAIRLRAPPSTEITFAASRPTSGP